MLTGTRLALAPMLSERLNKQGGAPLPASAGLAANDPAAGSDLAGSDQADRARHGRHAAGVRNRRAPPRRVCCRPQAGSCGAAPMICAPAST